MNFAGGDIEVDAVEGACRAEMLAHAFGVAAGWLMRVGSCDVIPGRRESGVPGIHNPAARCRRYAAIAETIVIMDSGLAPPARPGMTARAESINAALWLMP